MIVEVCANSVASALNAQAAGADRLEICVELGVGGITPSHGLLEYLRKVISIPMHVLIRPRSGDFVYSDSEFAIMLADIRYCLELGYNGIVSGVLLKNATVDISRTKLLVEAANGLPFTFHRAFDWVDDPMDALKSLEDIGVSYILSSGQSESARAGLDLLKQLHKKAERCSIIAAAGIRSAEALEFKELGFQAIHLSGVQMLSKLEQAPSPSLNTISMLQEDKLPVTDFEIIGEVVKTVK